MPRLHHSQIEDLLAEDHTCPDCMLDRADCVCMSDAYDDVFILPNYEPEDMWLEPYNEYN